MNLDPLTFKCVVDDCDRSCADSHVVCNYHLFFEITALVVAGFTGVGLLVWVILSVASR